MVKMGVMVSPYEGHCKHNIGKHHNIMHGYGDWQTWLAKNNQNIKLSALLTI
jgi:hypothetical protein